MKTILTLLIFLSVTKLFAQAPQITSSLKLEAISIEFKLVSQDYFSSFSFDEVSKYASDPSLFTVIDLSAYHKGSFTLTVQTPDLFYESPGGPVNTRRLLSNARYGLNASFKLLNHKTNEYRIHRELQLGLFYQPLRYHNSYYVRTDTLALDSFQYQYAYYDEWSPMIGIEGAHLFRINPGKWISAYAGAGISVAVSVHPQVAETFGSIQVIVVADSAMAITFPKHKYTDLSYDQNIFDAKPSMLVEAGIPFGVNINIAGGLYFYLEGEFIASKQIYSGAPSFPATTSLTGAAGLRLRL
ncbi:MAG: hypothetical protein ABIQ74_00480 [Chitinophagales bacterium]